MRVSSLMIFFCIGIFQWNVRTRLIITREYQKLQKLLNDIDKKGNLRTPPERLIVTNEINAF